MKALPPTPTRADVFAFLASSSIYGNLGAFVGAGLSKAVLNDGIDDVALSWGELLHRVANVLEVDYSTLSKEGVGYPEIASTICQAYATQNECQYEGALKRLKQEIAAQTAWFPDEEQRRQFSGSLENVGFAWFITTNYDLVIESLLIGSSTPLGPNDPLISPRGIAPVFHLHGARTDPDAIIIAQEDYVGLFRPTEYRQIKLALMIKESTMLVIGYGLGDVNVLTALDWSKNVYSSSTGNYPNEIVQVVHKSTPSEYPYRDKSSTVIIETSDLSDFLYELSDSVDKARAQEDSRKKEIREISEDLRAADKSTVTDFIGDDEFRRGLLDRLSSFPNELLASFVSFLEACINETRRRSSSPGAFNAYAQTLGIILDILTAFKHDQIPPALFATSAHALQRISQYVGNNFGQSYSAGDLWKQRKSELSEETIRELEQFGKQHSCPGVVMLARDARA